MILFSFGSVCSEGKNEDLLHEVILIVGYFTVLNNDNQVSNLAIGNEEAGDGWKESG